MSCIFFITVLSIILTVESKVCKSVDVRNTPSHISEFSDCRVIDGSLQIVLMENLDATDYINISFTELFEITEYLLIYRVMGLTTLDSIFPKLASIKGNSLFLGHSLVIYELLNLEEIGLKHLQSIENGNVKIANCPNLCYVNTINWTSLGVSLVHYNETAICSEQNCPFECRGFCWNSYTCQNTAKTRCDPSCIGCTQDFSSKHCVQCKYFNNSGTCLENCPKNKIADKHSGQCIERKDCISKNGSWTIFRNACVPKSLENAGITNSSKRKICEGMKIVNHFELEQMVNCTHINGSLEISLGGSVVLSDLERTLGKIVSISKYLKISRSHKLTSLQFFHKLRTIKGEQLWSKYYSLYIVKNQNLQQLFDKRFKLNIENGTVIFQDNPHLCPRYVDKFFNVTKIASKYEPYKFNNGHQASCIIKDMSVSIESINSTNITLSWKNESGSKTILGYTIFYTYTMGDRDLLKIKDEIGEVDGDSWSSIFVSNTSVIIENLYPYSHYAYYIKTHFLTSFENIQTPVYSFSTPPGDPTEPIGLEAEAKSDTIIELKWKIPNYINGELSYYKLAIYVQKDYLPMILQRNYCRNPFVGNGCTCLKKDILHLFLQKNVCIGQDGDHYCNDKTVYEVVEAPKSEPPKIRIHKRSVVFNSTVLRVQEFIINATDNYTLTLPVYGLEHFTMYTFYLRACNSKISENDTEHCGGPEMVSERTLKNESADIISFLSIQINKIEANISWTQPESVNSVILAYDLEYRRNIASGSISTCITSKKFDKQGYIVLQVAPGRYSVRVRALSLAGYGEYTTWHYFEIFAESSHTNHEWITGLLIFFGVIIIIVIGLVIYRRFKLAQNNDTDHLILGNHNTEMTDDEWVLDQETVEIIKDLKQNLVGMLYRKKEG